ncbi:pentatricopeptide repeat-containing protein At1g08070, chloroplastic-like [Chenopodium quinoa]|uniref:Chlororespiratory reduction 4 n=1 Tax=Chenopodium quinoa TaxID=63459 RepID=A0A803L5T2_CHEQI|nr:pentatricopeptide repeat-containing protein At1g08070, chloroplastic-like [Chenopodium quinoa]
MTVKRNLFKPITSFTFLSPQKRLKFHQSPPKLSSPKLWSNLKFGSSPDFSFDDREKYTLNLNHPILHKVDSSSNLAQFHQTQAQLIILGLLNHPLAASRAVKKLCSLPHGLYQAVLLLGKLDEVDAFMCNTIIRGFLNQGYPESGLAFYYDYMIGGCVLPNHYTFPLIIRVCVDIGEDVEGEKAHCRVLKSGFGLDLFVRNSLIRMYSVFGRMWDADKVFDESSECDIVSWNTMIDGYVKNGQVGLARNLFDEMPERDVFTWNSMLAGYVGVGDMEAAVEIFGAMPQRDVVSWNCLIDGCARMGDISAARECFKRMPDRNAVTWNSMLALCVRCKEYDECVTLFEGMIQGGAQTNEATLVSVLTACGYLCKLDLGKWVHHYIENNRRIKPDVLLFTALLTMYAKCGDMDMAKIVFDSMPEKSVVSWNSMIMGYGLHGLVDKALEMFQELENSGQIPNDATFVCVLAACAHSGKVLEGWWYFDIMNRVYKIEPKVEHYGCMVDLLGRAGLLKDTEELVKDMNMKGGPALWGALLSSCHSNIQLGEFVGKWLVEQEPEDIGAYLLLSNIYAALGRWEDVDTVRRLIKEKGLHKEAGYSKTCFGLGELDYSKKDPSFHRRTMIHSMLRQMSSQVKLSGISTADWCNTDSNAETKE